MFNVYLILAMGAAFGAVMTLTYAVASTASDKRRAVKFLEGQIARRVDLREEELERSFLQRTVGPLIGRFLRLMARFTPPGMVDGMRRKLALAGGLDAHSPQTVIALKFLGGLAAFSLVLMWTSLTGSMRGSTVFLAAFVGAIGFFAPDTILSGRGQRRQDAIRKALPDTMDLLTISVEAGLGLDAAIARVIKHVPGPLSEEFNRLLQEMRLGMSRIEALKQLKARTDLEELDAFVLAIVQADTFGVSIANVLRGQASELRTKRRQRAEEKAMKIPVKILFPLIFCVLPSLFVVVIGPGIIRIAGSLIGY